MGRNPINAPDGVIFVSMGRGPNYRQINTKSKFFYDCEYFLIDEDEQKIVFRRATLDSTGKVKKAVRYQGDWIKFQFTSEVPVGKYTFDPDDSNEDEFIVYFSEQVE